MDDQQRKLAEELLFSEKKSNGFAKALYFGDFEAERVFPFPIVPKDEQSKAEQFALDVRKLVEKELDANWIDRHAEIPQSLINSLGKLGVLGMTIPEEFGGKGLSQYSYCLATEEVAKRCGATALFINAHQSIGLKALLLFGTSAQKKRWLTSLAKGEALAAFSLTEPNAGSDASGVETRAVYDPTRKAYILNGRKQWTTNGSIASVLTVMAQTELETPKGKVDKITAFLVTPDMEGFKILAPALEKVGMRGSKTANLEFVNMVVPEENVLGPVGGGLKVCLTVLDYGRTTFGATCTGAAKFLVNQAIQHSQTRYQFKRPLKSFTLVKEKIARMSGLLYAMESTTYMTAGLVDQAAEDFMLEAAILKVFASDSLWSILYDTMQIYGGRSFFTDAPFERMMRDARLNMIGEGSNEVMRAFIGVVGLRDVGVEIKKTLDDLKNPFKNFDDLKKFSLDVFKKLKLPKVPVNSDKLNEEARALSKAVRRFGFSVLRVLKAYREDVIEKQLTLDRLATSAIALYTTTAVLSRMDMEIKNGTDTEEKLLSAKLYCRLAMDQLKLSLDHLFDNHDSFIEKVSDTITQKTN
jgi:alkylation response protein AidB-like acyl-CoA dehydrogenase